MKRKIAALSALVVALILAFALTACGGDEDNEPITTAAAWDKVMDDSAAQTNYKVEATSSEIESVSFEIVDGNKGMMMPFSPSSHYNYWEIAADKVYVYSSYDDGISFTKTELEHAEFYSHWMFNQFNLICDLLKGKFDFFEYDAQTEIYSLRENKWQEFAESFSTGSSIEDIISYTFSVKINNGLLSMVEYRFENTSGVIRHAHMTIIYGGQSVILPQVD